MDRFSAPVLGYLGVVVCRPLGWDGCLFSLLPIATMSINSILTIMDSSARRLVVDITDESDDGMVAYTFLR